MKKIVTVLLVMAVLFTLTACKEEEEKVSIYLPDTVTEYAAEDDTPVSVSYLLYPSGWETAESFTISYSLDGVVPNPDGNTITVEGNCTIRINSEAQIDEYVDSNGWVVSRNILYSRSSQYSTNVFSHDEHGRVLTRITSSGILGGQESYQPQVTFVYQDTEQGSKGTSERLGYGETYCYDKQYRLVSYASSIWDVESSRTEYVYDANGNVTEELYYVDGVLSSRTVTTYKIVEVAKTTADRMLQFKRG